MDKDILLGTLLGDASLSKVSKNSFGLSIEHSSAQEEYLRWKGDKLKISNIYYRERLDKRTNKTYKSFQLRKSSRTYKEYYNLLYNPTKEVSSEFLKLINVKSIGIWYCDDGCIYYNGNNCHLTLCTNGFSKESVDNIINWFKLKYDLNFKETTQGAIRLTNKKECIKFMDLVENYIPDCMNYKKLNNCIIRYESTLNTKQLKYRNGQLNKRKT